MSENEIENIVASLLFNKTGKEITKDLRLKEDLALDSLDIAELTMAIDCELDLPHGLPDAEIEKLNTVADVVKAYLEMWESRRSTKKVVIVKNEIDVSLTVANERDLLERLCVKVFGAKPMYRCDVIREDNRAAAGKLLDECAAMLDNLDRDVDKALAEIYPEVTLEDTEEGRVAIVDDAVQKAVEEKGVAKPVVGGYTTAPPEEAHRESGDWILIDQRDGPIQHVEPHNKELDDLRYQLAEARREVEVLRLYGNKDCTAMADACLEEEVEKFLNSSAPFPDPSGLRAALATVKETSRETTTPADQSTLEYDTPVAQAFHSYWEPSDTVRQACHTINSLERQLAEAREMMESGERILLNQRDGLRRCVESRNKEIDTLREQRDRLVDALKKARERIKYQDPKILAMEEIDQALAAMRKSFVDDFSAPTEQRRQRCCETLREFLGKTRMGETGKGMFVRGEEFDDLAEVLSLLEESPIEKVQRLAAESKEIADKVVSELGSMDAAAKTSSAHITEAYVADLRNRLSMINNILREKDSSGEDLFIGTTAFKSCLSHSTLP